MTDQDVSNQQPDIDPATGFNRLMVEQMARSIKIAHDINPTSWCVHSRAHRNAQKPILSIGIINIMSIGPGSFYELIIDTSDVEESRREIINDLVNAETRYSGKNWLKMLTIPKSRVKEVLTMLHHEHDRAVRRLATRAISAAQKPNFNSELVKQVEAVLGYELPQPAYITEVLPSVIERIRYWKISPGSVATYWPQFRDGGFIALNLSQSTVDPVIYPDDKSEFLTQIKGSGIGAGYPPHSLWDFLKAMRPGDKVLAYGNSTILGSGTVTGDVENIDDDFEYRQRRSVDWDSAFKPLPIKNLPQKLQGKLSSNVTLIELTSSEFRQSTGTPDDDQTTKVFEVSDIQNALAVTGLHYTNERIATFYTALQTKGFVVLSGISGTGKSKIAQGFVDLLPSGPAVTSLQISRDEGVISFTLKPYTKKNKHVILPSAQTNILPDMAPGTSQKLDLEFNGLHSRGTITRILQQSGALLHRLYFTGDIGRAIQDLPLNQPIFLSPVVDEDLAKLIKFDISLEPPISFDDESNPDIAPTTSNHLFLSVRPDWRDSTSLLGYFNPLTSTYEWTDFLRFIIRAGENFRSNDRIAWFIILDEMNLAHVEYYFADLLSVIESGRHDSGEMQGFTREPLRITWPETADDDMPPREIFLPPNLYIIGTVNMDETTHAFSPKVLDRAFTIELTDVDFRNYPPTVMEDAPEISDAEKRALLQAFTLHGQFAQIRKTDVRDIVEQRSEIRTRLQTLNTLLKKDRFHFGYRVFDEIAQYLANNDLNGMMEFEEAFDHAVFMKVLPKFSGSRARLRSPLLSVLAWAINPDLPDITGITSAFDKSGAEFADITYPDAKCRRVAERAHQMLAALETDGFVSFG